jgi:hypothetical protein
MGTDAPISEAGWHRLANHLANHVHGRYHEHSDDSLAAYADLVRDLLSRGNVRVVFLEAPAPRRTKDEVLGAELWESYRMRMYEFAAENGAEYWELAEECLVESDYFDYTHIYKYEARERFTDALAARIASRLAGAGG